MGDKEDLGVRRRELQGDLWEMKITRGRFRGSGR
jgi:hypothetical protein